MASKRASNCLLESATFLDYISLGCSDGLLVGWLAGGLSENVYAIAERNSQQKARRQNGTNLMFSTLDRY